MTHLKTDSEKFLALVEHAILVILLQMIQDFQVAERKNALALELIHSLYSSTYNLLISF